LTYEEFISAIQDWCNTLDDLVFLTLDDILEGLVYLHLFSSSCEGIMPWGDLVLRILCPEKIWSCGDYVLRRYCSRGLLVCPFT